MIYGLEIEVLWSRFGVGEVVMCPGDMWPGAADTEIKTVRFKVHNIRRKIEKLEKVEIFHRYRSEQSGGVSGKLKIMNIVEG